MCGRYHLTAPPERLGREYDLDIRENFPPRYNIAPTQPISVVHINETRKRMHSLMRWGFIPSWAKKEYLERMGGRPLINARGETIAEKPTFRSAWKRRRCLIPATGFYEWKSEKGGKQPYCIQQQDNEPFSFAGVWETATDPDGGEIDTVAIITTAAGPDLSALHAREPVVIQKTDYTRWLDTDERDLNEIESLIAPRPAGQWRYFVVSKDVNNARNEGAHLVEPPRDLFA